MIEALQQIGGLPVDRRDAAEPLEHRYRCHHVPTADAKAKTGIDFARCQHDKDRRGRSAMTIAHLQLGQDEAKRRQFLLDRRIRAEADRDHPAPRPVADLTVVQLVGAVNSPYGFDSESCASRIAAAFGGRCVNLHVPAIVSSPAMAEALARERVIAAQLDEQARINKVLFAVGSCNADSHIVSSGIASLDDIADYRARGAVGLICSRFIDSTGAHLAGPLDDRMIGLVPDRMRGLSVGILVSCGAEKVRGIHATLRGGYATHLFTDLPTAAGILALGEPG